MSKALVLFSGGLDSVLAVKVLERQGVEVVGICFTSNFYGDEKARVAAEALGVKLRTVDIAVEMLGLVKNPPSGYGKHLNPCIDCHSLMARTAARIVKDEGFDFVASGEVLGQRPFSQNKDALARVEKLSGTEILRPLSAKLLEETEAEKKGLVNRGRLLAISGRTRERQMDLAEEWGIKEYATPAGGCLLTDPEFSSRLLNLMDHWPGYDGNDVELLKSGRVHWFNHQAGKVLAVIGRHQADNENLISGKREGDVIIELVDFMGPTTLIRGKAAEFDWQAGEKEIEIPAELKKSALKLGEIKTTEEIIKAVCLLTGYYSTKARGHSAKCRIVV